MPTHRRRPRGLDTCAPALKRQIRAAVVERDRELCRWCSTGEGLTLDHVIPAARGGSNTLSNLQLLCAACNVAKGDTVEGREAA